MNFSGSFCIDGMSLFRSWKTSKGRVFPIALNLCLIGILLEPMMVGNATEACFVVTFAIGLLLAVIRLSQIFKSIICPIAIFVVNLIRWPSARNIKPSEAMHGVMLAIKFHIHIATVMKISCRLANAYFWARSAPRKNTRNGIVIQSVKEIGVRYFFHPDNMGQSCPVTQGLTA